MLIFRSSKADQEGVGEALYVTSDTRRIIKRYHKRVGKKRGALFRRIRRGGHPTEEAKLCEAAQRRVASLFDSRCAL